jgi:hypothetical protein
MMNELQCDNLWPTIKKLAKKPGQRRAAVAYVTSDEHVKFRKGDVLVTDASDQSIASGQTDAKLLDEAFQRDAELFSIPGLHCKVLLLGGTAIIGSANLSANSQSRVEAAWVSDHPAAVSMASSLIEDLTEQAEEIGPEFLNRIKNIEVTKTPWAGGGAHQKPKVKVHRPKTWIIGVHELIREFPEEQEAIAKGQATAEKQRAKKSSEVDWIRWNLDSHFSNEAQRGDIVIQIWSDRTVKKPTTVYRHATVLHRQREDACTRFYIEMAADSEGTAITWAAFRKLTKRVGLPHRVGPNSCRQIKQEYADALSALWMEK